MPKAFLESIGFLSTTESTNLWEINSKKLTVNRRVFLVKKLGHAIGYLLSVDQSIALGVHRNTEASWYFPITTTEEDILLHSEAVAIGLLLASKGIRPPSIIALGEKLPADSNSKVALMSYFVHGSKGLKWYIENC